MVVVVVVVLGLSHNWTDLDIHADTGPDRG